MSLEYKYKISFLNIKIMTFKILLLKRKDSIFIIKKLFKKMYNK